MKSRKVGSTIAVCLLACSGVAGIAAIPNSPAPLTATSTGSGSTSGSGILVPSTPGIFNPDLDIGPTGGSSTTTGNCIPGGLGCGPAVVVSEPPVAVLIVFGLAVVASRRIRRRGK